MFTVEWLGWREFLLMQSFQDEGVDGIADPSALRIRDGCFHGLLEGPVVAPRENRSDVFIGFIDPRGSGKRERKKDTDGYCAAFSKHPPYYIDSGLSPWFAGPAE